VLVVLGSLEAELAGELLAESVVLGSQAGDFGAGGVELIRPGLSGQRICG
jgi:hypothetical protein